MSKSTFGVLCLCLGVLVTLGAAVAETPKTFDDLMTQLGPAMDSAKSFSADMEMSMDMGGMAMKMAGTVKTKGKMSTMAMASSEGGMEMKMKTVLDADGTQWSETQVMGQTMVTKATAETIEKMGAGGPGAGPMSSDPKEAMKEFNKMFDLQVTGEEEVAGVPMYVVEGAVREDGQADMDPDGEMGDMAPGKVVIKVGQKDGIVRETKMVSKSGDELMTMKLSNIQVNPELADSDFAYTPPANARVQDLSKLGAMGAPGAPAAK